jgi:hypothetical protein
MTLDPVTLAYYWPTDVNAANLNRRSYFNRHFVFTKFNRTCIVLSD